MTDKLKGIALQFNIEGTIEKIQSFGNGHINDTYKVETTESDLNNYILQRKNHDIFKDVPAMMENIINVTEHIRKKLEAQLVDDIDRKVIRHIATNDNKYYYKDENGNFWALFLFIKDSRSVELIKDAEDAYIAGKGFGQFQKQLSDYDADSLSETIKDFHNIEFRYNNFDKSLKVNHNNRKAVAAKEIEFALSHKEKMHTLINAWRNKEIPLRITHNDTKINNILFDGEKNILSIIDLDTVMPGLVHFDFGDAIRTAASTAPEDETDLSKVTINLEIYEAFAKGFLEEIGASLNQREIELLPHSAQFMTFIMGLRFLTDYLEGDTYYKIKYPEHNIERCRAQFKLVEEMEAKEPKMIKIIENLVL